MICAVALQWAYGEGFADEESGGGVHGRLLGTAGMLAVSAVPVLGGLSWAMRYDADRAPAAMRLTLRQIQPEQPPPQRPAVGNLDAPAHTVAFVQGRDARGEIQAKACAAST